MFVQGGVDIVGIRRTDDGSPVQFDPISVLRGDVQISMFAVNRQTDNLSIGNIDALKFFDFNDVIKANPFECHLQ